MSWENIREDCMLCNMEKRTKWYEETEDFVIAEKLNGGPFIVVKCHKKDIPDNKLAEAHKLVEDIFGEHKFRVMMNIVTNHWHAHIITDEKDQLLHDE